MPILPGDMGLVDAVVGRYLFGLLLVASIVPVMLLGMATDTLVEIGLPRGVVGPIAAVLMVVWAVVLLGFVAKQVDWD
jgi:hypothetical protein